MADRIAHRSPRPRIELLGPPALIDAQGARVVLERKSAALLAVLAIDGARSRGRLAELLWPQAQPSAARNSLRQRLFRLHRSAGVALVVGNEELQLADDVVLDLSEPDERLARDPQAQLGALLEGLDYDDGTELFEWVNAARERVRRRHGEWLAEHASRHESRQQIALALQYAQRLLAAEPLLEHAHRRVMRLHYLRGDRGAALAAYEHCKTLLRAELGAAPDRETRELAETVGAQAISLARPRAPPVSVLRPPRVIGREAPRARLATAIAGRRVALVRGEPGIGKSRLFEELAQAHPSLLAGGSLAGDARVPYALLARIAGLTSARWPRHCPAGQRTSLPGWCPPWARRPRRASIRCACSRLSVLRSRIGPRRG